MIGKLFVVATPIGNLGDITLRALSTLKNVDFLVVEDSRVSIKLLNHFKIKKPMITCFRHSNRSTYDVILRRLLGGEDAAMVSDAGVPCISDPGENLVRICIESGIELIPIPGVNAALTGLILAGLECSRFCFEGFLPTNKKNRFERLNGLKHEPRTMIFYEAPHKLKNTLVDLMRCLGDRAICVARELTKIHEQFLRVSLKEAVCYFEEVPPRGEFVLVVDGCHNEDQVSEEAELNFVLDKAKRLLNNGMSVKEVAIALASGKVRKNRIYDILLHEHKGKEGESL
ncbi:MAG: 16S rRNA (cytidine(1402)-2'-O)-methyltransferase [Oscillospiraceae bacterium]|jgi:16S rRNA (cytidine1402-2'-O)-methyltransferase|nr:16S rRNA (cytidine(1402)-2'-O)-methyltransferase [Oscillospiraceae bacterium]